MTRHVDVDLDELIAAPRHHPLRNAFAADPQDRAGLRAGRDAELAPAIEGRHLDLAAEDGLRKGDGERADDVVADAAEYFVRLYTDDELEIARGTIGPGVISAALDDAVRAVLDARGDGD